MGTWCLLSLGVFTGELHEISLDESVDFSVHHTAHIAGLVACAMVFHATVIKDIGADLY